MLESQRFIGRMSADPRHLVRIPTPVRARSGSYRAALSGLGLIFLLATVPAALASGFSPGNILVSLADGSVEVRGSDGTLQSIISGPFTGQAKGIAIDSNGNLLVAYQWTDDHSNGNTVGVYKPDGTFAGTFGSGYNCDPLGVLVDAPGNIYVSERQCLGRILQFDPSGNLQQTFYVNADYVGAWWMDLASDGCTMHYTSDGQNVLRYNICTGTQLSNLNSAPLSNRSSAGALGVRILPDASLLVADHYNVQRLDSNGNVVGVYYGYPDNGLAAIALDPDGRTFWATDTAGAMLLHIDLSSGSILGNFPTSAAAKGVIVVPPTKSLTPAPVVTGLTFDSTTIRRGSSYTSTVSGSNLTTQTQFDILFRAPGSSADSTLWNWQIGSSIVQFVASDTPTGIWTITGLRAHQDPADHTGNFVMVSASVTVQ
jgi:sugar lactone lactonase YvrE